MGLKLTKEMRARLPAIGTHAEHSPDAIPVPCRIFNPVGIGWWAFYEADDVQTSEGPDVLLFGWCSPMGGQCAELGEQLLSEMQAVELPYRLSLEVDRHFACRRPYPTLATVLADAGADGLLAALRRAAVSRRAAMAESASVVYDRMRVFEHGGSEPSPLVRPAQDDDSVGLDCAVPA